MGRVDLSTNATKKDETLNLSTNEILDSLGKVISKIDNAVVSEKDKVSLGFNLSLTDIKKDLSKKINFNRDVIITGEDEGYLGAVEALYFIELSNKTVDNLISNFTVIKKIEGDRNGK